MNEKIQVEIISPTQAKEVNPYKKPKEKVNEDNVDYYALWQQAQYGLRTFYIKQYYTCQSLAEGMSKCDGQCEHCTEYYAPLDKEHNDFKVGSIHTAEIIEGTNKCIII
jgi:hypothetical protein